jgi:hypothetical protein
MQPLMDAHGHLTDLGREMEQIQRKYDQLGGSRAGSARQQKRWRFH